MRRIACEREERAFAAVAAACRCCCPLCSRDSASEREETGQQDKVPRSSVPEHTIHPKP